MSDPTPAVKPAAPANRNMLIIVLVGTNMLGLFGLGGYLIYSTRAGAQPPAAAAAAVEPGPAEHEMGPLVEFESMVVNLHEETTDHYLKLTFQLELASEDGAPAAEAHMTPYRDAVLMYLTSLGVADVAGPDGAHTVREHLLELARETLGEHAVQNIYFTEYLVQ
jgi:flagellar basal body-associated protein FliL